MTKQNERFVIGITGNIGAGKSTVTRALAKAGACVLDADAMTRELQAPGSEAVRAIAEEFGAQMAPSGILDRKALGALVFGDEAARARLNALMWRRLIEQTKCLLRRKRGVCIIDAALLIESGLHTVCDEVWLITAPEEIRCARIMKRDGLSEQQAWQRIKSQMPETQKKEYADCLLDSMVGERCLIEKARALYDHAVGGLYGKQ